MKQRTSRTYNIHEAKTNLSKLLEQTGNGEDVIIARAGVPIARLVPVVLPDDARTLGSEKGRLSISDDFDAPLPASVIETFER
jgi:prevent-host-death family protein